MISLLKSNTVNDIPVNPQYFNLSEYTDFSFLSVEGKDSSDFLDRLCTRDLSRQKMGEGKNTAILNNKGEICFLFFIFRQAENEWCLLGVDKKLFDYLDQRIFVEEVVLKEKKPQTIYYIEAGSSFQNFKQSVCWEVSFTGKKAHLYINFETPLDLDDKVDSNSNLWIWFSWCCEQGYFFLFKPVMDELKKKSFSLLELHLLDWVDENSGCYPGQEVVTRFLTQKKRFFQRLCVVFFSLNQKFSDSEYLKLSQVIEDKSYPDLGSPVLLSVSKTGRPYLLTRVKKKYLEQYEDEGFVMGEVEGLGMLKSEFSELRVKDCKDEGWRDYFDQGVVNYHQDKFDIAKEQLKKALSLDEFNPEVLEVLALIYEKQGDIVEAIKLNQQFSKSDPQSIMAHTNLSRLYMLQGHKKEAEDEKQKATVLMFRAASKSSKKKPTSDEVNEKMAREKKAEQERKLDIFSQVLELDPDDETAHFGKGKIYHELQNYKLAITHLERVISLQAEYSIAYQYLAEAYFKEGGRQKTLEVLDKGIVVAKKRGDLMPLKAMEQLLFDCKV